MYSISFLDNEKELNIKKIYYPTGEFDFIIKEELNFPNEGILINFNFSQDWIKESFELPFVIDMLKRTGFNLIKLKIDYLPFSRNDRSFWENSTFGLKTFINMLNGINILELNDAHNILNLVKICEEHNIIVQNNEQYALAYENVKLLKKESEDRKQNFALIAPDKGAIKKANVLAISLMTNLIVMDKKRDKESGVVIEPMLLGMLDHNEYDKYIDIDLNNFNRLILVDDICDGGATYIAVAKKIRELGFKGELVLHVTHGFFSKGKEILLEYYNKIYAFKEYNIKKKI